MPRPYTAKSKGDDNAKGGVHDMICTSVADNYL